MLLNFMDPSSLSEILGSPITCHSLSSEIVFTRTLALNSSMSTTSIIPEKGSTDIGEEPPTLQNSHPRKSQGYLVEIASGYHEKHLSGKGCVQTRRPEYSHDYEYKMRSGVRVKRIK